ncbi:MAG: aminopeptidase [Clostridia bacterium]|jgi:aspartyl aminopeptidase|nr:aminopeptidase [Clostridia bacterium]
MSFKYENKNGWNDLNKSEIKKVMSFSKRYMTFLNNAKTEREAVKEIIKLAKKEGFISLEEATQKKLNKPGTKIYSSNRDKSLALFILGKEPMNKGIKIIGSHIDSPRLDLKPNPMYEDKSLALLKTHYYGGIKKYQWATIALSLHGVVIDKNGNKIDVSIGDDDNDPVFYISDLLPHLSKDQISKKMHEGISGEDLNVIIGSIPHKIKKDSYSVKEGILNILNEKYGITEEDFISSEFELVPSFKAKDVGLDRSLIAGYGHDDKSCAYASLEAIKDITIPEKTISILFTDKEEIGSYGNSGGQSRFFEYAIAELINLTNKNYNELLLKQCFSNSKVISADVGAAFDSTYAAAYSKYNSAYIGHGVILKKYTGSRGKSGASDASAEYVGEIRKIFNDNNISWQASEMGKVDQGGGGTISYILANYNADVIDCGTPVLSMHAPIELISKVDLYNTYLAYKCFLN